MISHLSGTLPGFFATGNSFTVDAYVDGPGLLGVQLHESCMKACMREVLLTTLLPFVCCRLRSPAPMVRALHCRLHR